MSTKASAGGGLGGLLGLLLLIGLIIKFIWWILGAAALVGFYLLVRATAREYREQAAVRACHRAALVARADQQHNWVLQGDDRGIYGKEGAALMHYLYPAREQIRRA
jgi:type II secretory pathway pseudopilin PulG